MAGLGGQPETLGKLAKPATPRAVACVMSVFAANTYPTELFMIDRI